MQKREQSKQGGGSGASAAPAGKRGRLFSRGTNNAGAAASPDSAAPATLSGPSRQVHSSFAGSILNYFKKLKPTPQSSSIQSSNNVEDIQSQPETQQPSQQSLAFHTISDHSDWQVSLDGLETDSGLRIPVEELDYRKSLIASIDCVRFILRQGWTFCGSDQSVESQSEGDFLELLKLHSCYNDEVANVVLKNVHENHRMTSLSIQREITSACAYLTTKVIIEDIVNEKQPFSLLVDECDDVSVKGKKVIVVRYVDKKGSIIERFLGIIHVSNTDALSLHAAIKLFFAKHGLSISSLRGQGYDGATNMWREFNDLKTLILQENKSAFYVHCFAHRLQSVLVGAVQDHSALGEFFYMLSILADTVSGPCKCKDACIEKHRAKVVESIVCCDVETGRGLSQESIVQRPGDTRRGSHYGTITSVIKLFSSVVYVLRGIKEDGEDWQKMGSARILLRIMENFEFVFLLMLMRKILGITNDLSNALQRKDQDLRNAMQFVITSKQQLNEMRNEDVYFDNLLEEACELCSVNDIPCPDMKENFGKPRRGVESVTNNHHFKVELMYSALDIILEELNSRFDEVNMRLLDCMSCLDPSNSFAAFDKGKLVKFAEFYPYDFSDIDLLRLEDQLDNYYADVSTYDKFSHVEGISDLAKKMVECKMDYYYDLVYLLVKLALVLPVATATVKRVPSTMNLIKTFECNNMGDEWLNDCLVTYVERDVFDSIDNEDIIKRFEEMSSRM